MKRALLFLVGLVAVVGALALIRGPANHVPANEVLLVQVPVSEQPFLWNGRKLDDRSLFDKTGKPKAAVQHMEAVSRFPDVRSCLLPDAEVDGQLDVLRTNWVAIHSGPELEVCVFRIVALLEDPEKTLDWAVRSGFEAELWPDSTSASDFRVDGRWPRRKFGSLTPYSRSLLQDWLERVLLSANTTLRLTIFLDEAGLPLRVQSGIPYE
jgi:hypothetical protein